MIWALVWLPEALDSFRRLRLSDPAGATVVAAAARRLVQEPRPAGSSALGTTAFRRLRIGDYRILYTIEEETHSVCVTHVGRIAPKG